MKKIFAANWKLHKTPQETRRFLSEFSTNSKNVSGDILIFPPASSWEACGSSLSSSHVKWGAQNIWSQAEGAFTGENSAVVLKELGGQYALIGHSERRKVFGETDEGLAEKVTFVQSLGLTPLFCIGETLQERESGQTNQVNRRQIEGGLKKADPAKPLIVAYEPVWAIGTGKVATPEQVAETHAQIHADLKRLGFGSAPLLYGGSVKPDNAGALLKIPHVDGFLVGGASLEPASFLAICQA